VKLKTAIVCRAQEIGREPAIDGAAADTQPRTDLVDCEIAVSRVQAFR
jgi:hypothetical protein